MTVDWSKVITSAVQAIVVTVLLGAAAIIWNGVMTVDKRIDAGTHGQKAIIKVLGPKVENLETGQREIKTAVAELIEAIKKSPIPILHALPAIDHPEPLPDDARTATQMIQQHIDMPRNK
jgi:hypothetical protein